MSVDIYIPVLFVCVVYGLEVYPDAAAKVTSTVVREQRYAANRRICNQELTRTIKNINLLNGILGSRKWLLKIC